MVLWEKVNSCIKMDLPATMAFCVKLASWQMNFMAMDFFFGNAGFVVKYRFEGKDGFVGNNEFVGKDAR